MLKDERWNLSPTGSHVQRNWAKPGEAHEHDSVGSNLVEKLLGCAELVPVMAWLVCVRGLLLFIAEMKDVVEVELTIELLEWSNPSAPVVPPAQKDS